MQSAEVKTVELLCNPLHIKEPTPLHPAWVFKGGKEMHVCNKCGEVLMNEFGVTPPSATRALDYLRAYYTAASLTREAARETQVGRPPTAERVLKDLDKLRKRLVRVIASGRISGSVGNPLLQKLLSLKSDIEKALGNDH